MGKYSTVSRRVKSDAEHEMALTTTSSRRYHGGKSEEYPLSPLKRRIPETGSWPATIFLWVVAIFFAFCGVWEWTICLALFSLGVLPPLNRVEEEKGTATK